MNESTLPATPLETFEKSPHRSRTIWGGVILLLSGLSQLLEIEISNAEITDGVTGLATFVGFVLVVVGRIKAKSAIKVPSFLYGDKGGTAAGLVVMGVASALLFLPSCSPSSLPWEVGVGYESPRSGVTYEVRSDSKGGLGFRVYDADGNFVRYTTRLPDGAILNPVLPAPDGSYVEVVSAK